MSPFARPVPFPACLNRLALPFHHLQSGDSALTSSTCTACSSGSIPSPRKDSVRWIDSLGVRALPDSTDRPQRRVCPSSDSFSSFLNIQLRPNEVETEEFCSHLLHDARWEASIGRCFWPTSSRPPWSSFCTPALDCVHACVGESCCGLATCPVHGQHSFARRGGFILACPCSLRPPFYPAGRPSRASIPKNESHAITTATRGRLLGERTITDQGKWRWGQTGKSSWEQEEGVASAQRRGLNYNRRKGREAKPKGRKKGRCSIKD